MSSRISFIIGGVGSILVGAIILTSGRSPIYGFSVPHATGIPFLGFGLLLILYMVFGKAKTDRKNK